MLLIYIFVYTSIMKIPKTLMPNRATSIPHPSGLFSFNLEGLPSETVAEELNKRGIAVRGGFHCAPLAHRSLKTGDYGAVRASFGFGNKIEETDSFYRALKEIAEGRV